MNENSLAVQFSKYKDDALRKIVYTDYADYEEEALNTARTELFGRYGINIWEADDIKLGQLVKYCTFEDIAEKFDELYPDEDNNISQYQLVFAKLTAFENSGSQGIKLSVQKVRRPFKKANWDVHGIDVDTDEDVEIQYCKWSEWVQFQVLKEQLQKLGKEAYVAICLKAMTTEGFDEEEIQKKFNGIHDTFDSIDEPHDEPSDENISISGVEDGSINNFIYEGIKRREEFKVLTESENIGSFGVRPWVRYFARGMDIYIWFGFLDLVLKSLLYDFYQKANSVIWVNLSLAIIKYFMWTYVEAVLLSKTGFTIGKWVLNVFVRDHNGNELGFETSIKRALYVFLYGEGLGIPIAALIAYVISYTRLTGNGITKWDECLNIRVSHKKIEWYRVLIAVFILVIVPALSYASYWGF